MSVSIYTSGSARREFRTLSFQIYMDTRVSVYINMMRHSRQIAMCAHVYALACLAFVCAWHEASIPPIGLDDLLGSRSKKWSMGNR